MRAGGGDLQKQRQDIIQDLETKINLLELDVTLVFDAQYQKTESSRSHLNHLEICFTSVDETADEYIVQALKEDTRPTQQTVVTSDKKLAWLSRRSHARTESVEEFISWLNRRYKNKLRDVKSKKKEKEKIKEKDRQKSIPIPKEKQPSQPIELQPNTHSTPEECFDFYLNHFEKEFISLAEKIEQNKQAKKSTSLKKKRKPSPQPEASTESDTLRWLKAFTKE